MKKYDFIHKKILAYRRQKNTHIEDAEVNNVVDIFIKSNKLNSWSINESNIEVVGMGGNGIVFKYVDKDDVKCIKCLYSSKENRIKRFCKEIDAMQRLSDIKEVLPLLENGLSERLTYFVMPFCSSYNVHGDAGLAERLRDMIQLANIIKSIHNTVDIDSHRDIKLGNIYKEEGKVYLSDFGLVKYEQDDENLTEEDKRIGPFIISPPEFFSKKLRDQMESYKVSDVYLLSKVVWQVIKKDPYGFWGQYTDLDEYFIDSESLSSLYGLNRSDCISPINEMIINTTNNRISVREKYNIDYCIGCLEKGLELLKSRSEYKNRYDNMINNLMFSSSNMKVVVLLDERTQQILSNIFENGSCRCTVRNYKKTNNKFFNLNVSEFNCTNETVTIEALDRAIFDGKPSSIIVDNGKKEILVKFEGSVNDLTDTIYDDISQYNPVENMLNASIKQDGLRKYLLDDDCELSISFKG